MISGLSKESLSRLLDLSAINRELASRSLVDFIRQAWHVVEPVNPYVHGWHIDAIAEHLEAITAGQITRLLINVPPGAMKSLMCGVFWPMWEWGPKGLASTRYVATAHNQDLAVRDNVKARRLVESDWYQQHWGNQVRLMPDQNEKLKFENQKTGFRQAMSITAMTGSRGDRVIIDDPLSRDAAPSEAYRESVNETFRESLPTRLNNPEKSAIIVVMQRLHERDVAGMILANDWGYEKLILPMEFESGRRCVTGIGFSDPRTEENELLFPERFPRHVVERDKKVLGSYATAGQFQQRPSPAEGGIFKREWFKFYKEKPRKFDSILQSWDCTFKDAETSDYVAGTVWGRIGADKYLLDLVRDRMGIAATMQAIRTLTAKWPGAVTKLVEDKANGTAVIELLQRDIAGLIAVNPAGGKVVRAQAVSPEIEAGNVWLPDPSIAPWVHDFIEECAGFPNGAHDDMVDSMTQALVRFQQNNVGEPRAMWF